MSIFLAALGFGLVTAAVLSVSAVGITLQFAVTDVLNLAFGGVMIVSAYAAYAVNMSGASVWVGLVVAMVVGALLSVALNRFIYTPFQRRGTSPIAVVIVSLGMTLILEFGLQAFVGGDSVSYRLNPGPTLNLLGLQLSIVQLILILIAVGTMLAIHSLLRYSRLGKAMRATAANRSLARNSGIRTERVVTITWLISGTLAGLGGTVFAIDSGSFGATSTDLLLVLILSAVFLGGPGQAYGAMLGALIIGVATEVSAVFISPQYKDVVAFILLFVMLAWRPTGLLGARERS
jgi:branched-subunit amino acid ABC-type transport system permease component